MQIGECKGLGGAGALRRNHLMGVNFYFGVMEIFWNQMEVVVSQVCIKCHWIVHFKIINLRCVSFTAMLFLIFSIPLTIKEMRIKTTMRYKYTPIKTAKIKSSDNTKCCQVYGTTGSLIHYWWECKINDYSLTVSYKPKHSTTIQPGNHNPGHLSQKSENLHLHKNLYTNPRSSLFVIAKKCKPLKNPSIGEWLNKLWYLCFMKY